MQMISKKLKIAMLVIVALIALVLISEYRTIQMGAFSLGLKVSELSCRR